jgi:hypothetical protein
MLPIRERTIVPNDWLGELQLGHVIRDSHSARDASTELPRQLENRR